MTNKLERSILVFEKISVTILILFIVLSVFFKLIARNFLGSHWAIDVADIISNLIPHLVMLLGILGASIGISRSEVIQIDLINRFLKEKYQKIVLRMVYVATALLLGLFTLFAAQSLEFGEKYWILFGYIPGFSLLLLKSVLKILH